MDKIWKVMIDFIIAIGIMFIAVMVYYGLRTETVVKSLTTDITEDFILSIKEDGAFTLDEYENYIEKLSYTNAIYNIDFEHQYEVLEPEYRFRTLEEIIAAQNEAYEGSNDYHYKEVVSELPVVEDPVNTDNLNTENNESVMRNSVDKAADPNHIHTDECYGGHRHEGAKEYPHVHKHSTKGCSDYLQKVYIDYTCKECSYEGTMLYHIYGWDHDANAPYLATRVPLKCYNLSCGSTEIIGREQRYSYGYSCAYMLDLDGDELNDIVDYNKEYTYYLSVPQELNINVSQEYTNGCYSTMLKGYFHSPYYNAYYEKEYYGDYVMDGLRSYGLDGFCEIPKSYDFDITFYSQYNDFEETVSFTLSKTADGRVQVRDSWFNILSFEEFIYYTYDSTNLLAYLKTYTSYRDIVRSAGSIIPRICRGTIFLCNHEAHNVWTTNCGLEEGGGLACDKIIVNLEATHPVQKVFIGDDLITTARATYLNGSEKTIICNTEFVADELGQDIPVTLWTSYTIVNREYRKTCEILVTVIPRAKTCANGHQYYLRENGHDPGCPYCKAWARNLRIIYPNTPTLIIQVGTTLKANNIQILVTYISGETEVITDGYIDNLDSKYLGSQLVTIGYKGAITTVMVTTVKGRILCDICGYEYELYPNGDNPGCPRCLAKTPIFTGNILVYQKINYTEEILAMLQERGEYTMNKDDVFVVDMASKTSTIGRNIMKRVYPTLTDKWYQIRKNIRIRTK